MEIWTGLTTVLLPVLYLVLWGAYVWSFVEDRSLARDLRRVLVLAALAAHLAHVALLAFSLHRFPMGSPLEFLSLLSLTILVLYLVGEKVLRVRGTGFLVLGLVFLFQLVASAFAGHDPGDDPLLHDPGYIVHAVLILLAYTALSLSFLYAVLYLVQERQLSRRTFGLLFRRLPPLETLERMSVGLVRLGVPLLFLALASGQLWMYRLRDALPADQAAALSPYDPKVLFSWVVFLGYLIGLVGHERFGWGGRRMNRLAIGAYVAMVAVLGLLQRFAPSFHNFRAGGGA